MSTKVKLSITEQIDRARDGRSQISIIKKMKAAGIHINDVVFSRKKNGHDTFTEEELTVLSEILGTKITD